jgi:23S rRNA pseudouridine2604 synthase
MRINKYLAHMQHCTRREADTYIAAGKVLLNGKTAVLGDKVAITDTVEVLFKQKSHRYFAYNKPVGITTHSAREYETDIHQAVNLNGIFPIGRLDKASHGLIILTDDGRITDKLLHPDFVHEKEYLVVVREDIRQDFAERMSNGLVIGDYTTRPCTVDVLDEHTFTIILTEGKKHQIRRMCEALGYTIEDLSRIRVMNVKLGSLKQGEFRPIEGAELATFLKSLGFVS